MQRYRDVYDLETGSFGTILRSGTHIHTDEEVVLKYLTIPRSTNRNRGYTSRESDVHSALSKHPSIAEFVEHFMHEGREIIVVKKYETDLQKMLTAEPLAAGHIQQFMRQLLEGVEFIHKKGYIHRDIKPENLFIHRNGDLKIGDFGLGRQADNKAMTPDVMTQEYRAIELLLGAKEYTNAVDLWSVGCVMAEMYRRVPVFKGESSIVITGCVFHVCGVPKQEDWPQLKRFEAMQYFELFGNVNCQLDRAIPNACPNAMALIKKFFVFQSDLRITATDALKDIYFTEPDSSTLISNVESITFP